VNPGGAYIRLSEISGLHVDRHAGSPLRKGDLLQGRKEPPRDGYKGPSASATGNQDYFGECVSETARREPTIHRRSDLPHTAGSAERITNDKARSHRANTRLWLSPLVISLLRLLAFSPTSIGAAGNHHQSSHGSAAACQQRHKRSRAGIPPLAGKYCADQQ
jgi:hypothetical protein